MSHFTAPELGFPLPPAPPPGPLPPGDGRAAVPNFLSFSSLVTTAARTYRYTFDEALRHSRANAMAMRRDPVLMEALRARQIPTAQLSWHLEPEDDTDQSQADAAELVTSIVERMPRFQQFRMHLLEALWYGRYAVGVQYAYDFSKPNRFTGGRRLVPRDFHPINGDKLRFKWDGRVGVLVHAEFPGDKESTDFGLCHFLTPTEREQTVVHRHEPEDADFYEPELGGAVHGVGIRGRVYWFWWLKSQVLGMLTNYLERFSNGLTLYYYDASNVNAKAEMEAAVRDQNGNFALLVPRWDGGRDKNTVERIEVGTASPALLERLVCDYFDATCRRFILGQTLSSDTAPTGLGSGVAESHMETLSRILKYDAVALQDTISSDLIEVLYRYNAPGVPPARFVFEIDETNASEVLGHAQIMNELGLAIDGDHLYDLTKLPRPTKGSTTLSKLQPMQPTAIGQPEGVPVAGGTPMSPPPEAAPATAA